MTSLAIGLFALFVLGALSGMQGKPTPQERKSCAMPENYLSRRFG